VGELAYERPVARDRVDDRLTVGQDLTHPAPDHLLGLPAEQAEAGVVDVPHAPVQGCDGNAAQDAAMAASLRLSSSSASAK